MGFLPSRAGCLARPKGLIYVTAPFPRDRCFAACVTAGSDLEVFVLESILHKFRGIVLGLMVLSLSAIFILQFGGPQAEGCSKGAGQTYAAEVYGDNISVNEYRAAFALAGGDNYPPDYAKQHQLNHMVLRGLVERSLLVRQAKTLGMNANPEDVMHKIAEDGVVHMSMSVDAGPYLPPAGPRRFDFKDQNGKFNKDNLRKFIQYRLRRSVEEFANEHWLRRSRRACATR
jgi:hypothetical protein